MSRTVKNAPNPVAEWRDFKTLAGEIGLFPSLRFEMQRVRRKLGLVGSEFTLTARDARYPLRCRRASSDIEVFGQIFRQREYSCLDDIESAALVVDCGANVGYSSAYFLSRFPGCEVIAIEPDPMNHAMLLKNLAPFGDRVKAVRAGVWSHPCRLKISEELFRDGKEWSRQVRECRPDEDSDLVAVDILGVLEQSGHKRISILKVDIEGAECVVFSENAAAWIDRVDCIVIELHDSSFGRGSDVFFRAIKGRGFVVSSSGELTVCRRPK